MTKRALATALLLLFPGISMAQQQMTAVRIHEFGETGVLSHDRVTRPTPGEGEMVIRVRAAGVNPVDTQMRRGEVRSFAGGAFPYPLGFDVSGVVVEVGAGVREFGLGDEIYALLDLRRGGGYAEYALVKESEAAPKPESVSLLDAAAIPLVTLTAWQALFDTADLQPGETVLIHAGAGGVGSMAVQLAKWRGATVYATASDYNHTFLREIGTDVPIDYRNQRFEDVVDEVDVILDTIGDETQLRSLGMLADDGRLVSITGLTAEGREDPRATAILVHPDAEQLRQIGELLDRGILQPIVSHVMPLNEAAAAHEQSETGRTRGKIVLEIGE